MVKETGSLNRKGKGRDPHYTMVYHLILIDFSPERLQAEITLLPVVCDLGPVQLKTKGAVSSAHT